MLLGIFPIYKKTKQNPNKHNTVYTALAANSCFIAKLVFLLCLHIAYALTTCLLRGAVLPQKTPK